MKTDSLFYRLFRNHPGLALDLLGLNYSPDSYRFGAEDIKQTSFRLDGVFTPLSSDAEQPYIFAEIQYQPDPDFYDRLFSEIALYLRINKPTHPWMALVIYPTRGTERPANIGFRPFLTLPQLQQVYLEDFPNREHPTPRLGLLSLIASDPRQTLVLARDWLRQHGDTSTDTLDFIETILVYKLPRLSREEIRLMLGLEDTQLKQTRFYQQAVSEGRVEGRVEGEATLLLRQLERRFGPLSEDTRRRIAEADADTLLVWGERLLDTKTLAELWES